MTPVVSNFLSQQTWWYSNSKRSYRWWFRHPVVPSLKERTDADSLCISRGISVSAGPSTITSLFLTLSKSSDRSSRHSNRKLSLFCETDGTSISLGSRTKSPHHSSTAWNKSPSARLSFSRRSFLNQCSPLNLSPPSKKPSYLIVEASASITV